MKHAREDYNRITDPTGLIPADEPVFLLRAQDETAAEVVRFWAKLQEGKAGGDLHAAKVACNHADLMDAWKVKKIADIPKPEPPPEVRVPDCLLDDNWVAVDSDGLPSMYNIQPFQSNSFWQIPSDAELGMYAEMELVLGKSLILPDVSWTEACWKVSDLRKMQIEYEAWKEPEDEYVNWQPGELPKCFRYMEAELNELQVLTFDGMWQGKCKGNLPGDHAYRMKRSDFNRLCALDSGKAKDST